MNIRDLEYILAVATNEHFGKAAEQCHVSQPTLSGQIKKIEDQLGIKIFERTNRRVLITDVGKEIVIAAKNVLREVATIKTVAKNTRNPLSGKFRLGAFPTIASYIFPDLVSKVKKELPQLRLILIEEKTEKLLALLNSGEIDAAFIALPVHDEFLESKELFVDKFYLAAPLNHELAKKKYVSIDTLVNQKLLLLEEGHCLRAQALGVCQQHGIDEEQDFKATSLETLRQMVKAGTGITLIPEIAIPENDSGICYIPISDPTPARTIGLVWRKTSVREQVIAKLITMF